jgi:glycosyltransferase involved in cell wall biosynthesis
VTQKSVQICTIVARNYIPAARVLSKSFLEQHPEGRVAVLVLDDVGQSIDDSAERFEVLRPEDLFEDSIELHRMQTIYELTEFATSMKPWLLRYLLDRGADSVLYLDPDIAVFDRLDELVELAESTGIVLIPHARAPIPRDGKMTSESAILAVGIYNLGFIGVGRKSGTFLDFWQERLRRECRNDPTNMRFVDQRWVDFVPAMFESTIVRDPRFNVAYWNLHEREVEWTGDHYEVEGRPLGFFHFSGYSPQARHVLSRHQIERPRILLSDHPPLRKLFGEYGDALEASGLGVEPVPEYGLNKAKNGVPLDSYVRRLYLEQLLEWEAGERDGPPPPDPFEPQGAGDLVEWLNSIAPSTVGPSRLTYYQATLYAFTPELQTKFPEPQGADFASFMQWLGDEARKGRIDRRLVLTPSTTEPDTERALSGVPDTWEVGAVGEPGLTIAGYMTATHSIGELGRLMETAVRASGISSQSVVFDPATGVSRMAGQTGRRHDFDTNLVVVNADELPRFASSVGSQFFEGRYTIGNWAWELEEFPSSFGGALDLVDEVWAISEFTRRSIAAATDKPVFAAPPPVIAPVRAPGVGRAELGLPDDRFIFLFCFDLQSVIERKNPLGLIEAFKEAFEPGDGTYGPLLVLKTINGDSRPMDLEMVRIAAAGRPDIVVTDGVLAQGHLGSLMAEADCYVSLHRSEGLGLTMAESMALGKPVIATAYSGNLDFMTEENSYLVPFSPSEVPAGAEPYRAGARWAEPDIGKAASLMRKVVEGPQDAAAVGARGKVDVEERLGVSQRARFVSERYEAISRSETARDARARSTRGGATSGSARSVAVAASLAGRATDRLKALERRLARQKGR